MRIYGKYLDIYFGSLETNGKKVVADFAISNGLDRFYFQLLEALHSPFKLLAFSCSYFRLLNMRQLKKNFNVALL